MGRGSGIRVQIELKLMQGLLEKFQNLGRYKDRAPHKPLLVLALLDWTERLKLEENCIPINGGLTVQAMGSVALRQGELLVDSCKDFRKHHILPMSKKRELQFIIGIKRQLEKMRLLCRKVPEQLWSIHPGEL